LEGPYSYFSALTTFLTGYDAVVNITLGNSISNEVPKNLLLIESPFSIAYGGAGGSYGGHGGQGYGANPVGPTYNDEKITDLLGGSGGCMRAVDPYDINSVLGPAVGFGGHGGGAIEFIAANDITVGSYGKILAIGGNGQQSSEGGLQTQYN
jgi:hypothetical protein